MFSGSCDSQIAPNAPEGRSGWSQLSIINISLSSFLYEHGTTWSLWTEGQSVQLRSATLHSLRLQPADRWRWNMQQRPVKQQRNSELLIWPYFEMHIQRLLVNMLSHVTAASGMHPSDSEYSSALLRGPGGGGATLGGFLFFRHLLVYFICWNIQTWRVILTQEEKLEMLNLWQVNICSF